MFLLILLPASVALAADVCNPADLVGPYAFQLTGSTDISGTPRPTASLGRIVFDGRDSLSGTASATFRGLLLGNPVTGSYEAKWDCSVTWQLQDDSGAFQHFSGTLSPDGTRVQFKQTDPGGAQRGIMQKTSDTCSPADLQKEYYFTVSGSTRAMQPGEVGHAVSAKGKVDIAENGSFQIHARISGQRRQGDPRLPDGSGCHGSCALQFRGEMNPRAPLEQELQTQLNDPRVHAGFGDRAPAGNQRLRQERRRPARPGSRCDAVELRMVQQVEELRAELQMVTFRDIELLGQRGIEVELARPRQDADTGVSEQSSATRACGLGGYSNAIRHDRGSGTEGAGIEIAGASAVPSQPGFDTTRCCDVAIGHARTQLGPREPGGGLVAVGAISRPRAGIQERERNAILNRGDAREIPATEDRMRDTLELARGYLPTVIDDEPLRPVKVRGAVLLCQITGIVAVG
jgi:hypothetical protein